MPARVTTILIAAPVSMPDGRRVMLPNVPDQPVKKQSKWSPEEDALIIELRGSGMKWEDISKRLPGRSAISCRLHYQNYLERRSEWDEDRKNKLARLYERFKAEMWAKVAEELQVPWRAAEAMHWQLGETEMARRAGVVPFSLAAVNVEAGRRNSPSRIHAHPQPQVNLPLEQSPFSPRPQYSRMQPVPGIPGGRPIASRRDSIPIPPPPTLAQPPPPPPPPPSVGQDPSDIFPGKGPGLAPIQRQPQGRHTGLLPGVAELTTGVSPYGAPPSLPGGPPPGTMNTEGGYFPHVPPYVAPESSRPKRRASPPETGQRETRFRRRVG